MHPTFLRGPFIKGQGEEWALYTGKNKHLNQQCSFILYRRSSDIIKEGPAQSLLLD
ncbi:hypothetical protein XENTR_v10012020 [Xenopus tropicalis]|nr:hypothetical protein XENTR_v10012020 [Xenopus tropicalis]